MAVHSVSDAHHKPSNSGQTPMTGREDDWQILTLWYGYSLPRPLSAAKQDLENFAKSPLIHNKWPVHLVKLPAFWDDFAGPFIGLIKHGRASMRRSVASELGVFNYQWEWIVCSGKQIRSAVWLLIFSFYLSASLVQEARSATISSYHIGNSFTSDAQVPSLPGVTGWHLRGGQTLGQAARPALYPPNSVRIGPWNEALVNQQFDLITIQPMGGFVVYDNDFNRIDHDLSFIRNIRSLQPNATIAIYETWPMLYSANQQSFANWYNDPGGDYTWQNSVYWDRLSNELSDVDHVRLQVGQMTVDFSDPLVLYSSDGQHFESGSGDFLCGCIPVSQNRNASPGPRSFQPNARATDGSQESGYVSNHSTHSGPRANVSDLLGRTWSSVLNASAASTISQLASRPITTGTCHSTRSTLTMVHVAWPRSTPCAYPRHCDTGNAAVPRWPSSRWSRTIGRVSR